MKIVDEKTLDEFRTPGPCEMCGKSCKVREPHHVSAKGMGGGNRLDIRCNLVALGSTPNFECECHSRVDNAAGRERCIEIIAKREGCEPSEVEAVVNWFRSLPKGLRKIDMPLMAHGRFSENSIPQKVFFIALQAINAMPDQSPAPRPLKKKPRRKSAKREAAKAYRKAGRAKTKAWMEARK